MLQDALYTTPACCKRRTSQIQSHESIVSICGHVYVVSLHGDNTCLHATNDFTPQRIHTHNTDAPCCAVEMQPSPHAAASERATTLLMNKPHRQRLTHPRLCCVTSRVSLLPFTRVKPSTDTRGPISGRQIERHST